MQSRARFAGRRFGTVNARTRIATTTGIRRRTTMKKADEYAGFINELICELHRTILDAEFGTWSDLWCGKELPPPFPPGLQLNIWGEERDALATGNSFSINICYDGGDPLIEKDVHSDSYYDLRYHLFSALDQLKASLIASGAMKGPKVRKSRAKYRKGETIRSLSELAEQQKIYCFDKVLDQGWFMCWQLRLAKQYVEAGALRKAYKKEEES